MNLVGVDVRDEEGGQILASGVATVVLGPFNFANRPTKTWTLMNLSPTSTLSGAVLQVNPDRRGNEVGWMSVQPATQQLGPNPGLWMTYDATTFANLGPGQMRGLVSNDLFRWWRLLATSNLSGVTIMVSGWVNASTI